MPVTAWQASAEGVDLMRRSGAASCQAHVEAGAAVAEAEEMRDRALTACTGG